MAAINPNDLSKFVGILEIADYGTTNWVRVASVRNLTHNFDNTAQSVDIKADDTGTVFKGFKPESRIEGSFLENADRDLMLKMLGGTDSDVAGSLVSGATQVVASGAWGYNDPIVVENQNGDGSLLTINSVTGGTDGLLVANTDYFVGQNAAGQTVITIIDSATVTTEAQTMTIDYDYTPNATEKLSFSIAFTESPRLAVRITATSGSNTRRWTIDDATFEGIYGHEFLDVVEAGDLTGTTFVFKASSGATALYENQIL